VSRARFGVANTSPEATENMGEAWGRVLVDGDLLLLVGDLGAGKTTLVRGLARGLGVRWGVKSPTFALHLEYPGRLPLHHLDLYRVTRLEDVDELGVEDWFGRDGVSVVEWGDRVDEGFVAMGVRVEILDTGDSRREFAVSGPAEPVTRLAAAAGVKPETLPSEGSPPEGITPGTLPGSEPESAS